MSRQHSKSGFAPWLVVAVLVIALPALYMGAYYAMVQAVVEVGGSGRYWRRDVHGPYYRAGGDVARVLFQPAHTIDRKLRPDHWTSRTMVSPKMDEFWEDYERRTAERE